MHGHSDDLYRASYQVILKYFLLATFSAHLLSALILWFMENRQNKPTKSKWALLGLFLGVLAIIFYFISSENRRKE
jgi:predicted PurR-regulated permease PerM